MNERDELCIKTVLLIPLSDMTLVVVTQ